MSCIPSHLSREDEIAQRLQREKRDLAIDPRKIRRQHRWKLGHDPADPDTDGADPNVRYITIDYYDPLIPDQRGKLTGGPVSGMPCAKCGGMTNIVGHMTKADILRQPEVGIANLDDITKERWKELEADEILVLGCPKCQALIQMEEMFVPSIRRGKNHA